MTTSTCTNTVWVKTSLLLFLHFNHVSLSAAQMYDASPPSPPSFGSRTCESTRFIPPLNHIYVLDAGELLQDEENPHISSLHHIIRSHRRETLWKLSPLFYFFPRPALTVGSSEVLCPSSPCPWELCLRAGAGGVPPSTMCASHSGSRCTPLPLHGSGELPSSEGLSVRVGERTRYSRTAPNTSLPFSPKRTTGYKSLPRIGWLHGKDAVMNNQTNCNKQCEVVVFAKVKH